jgi:hypothetical protein
MADKNQNNLLTVYKDAYIEFHQNFKIAYDIHEEVHL